MTTGRSWSFARSSGRGMRKKLLADQDGRGRGGGGSESAEKTNRLRYMQRGRDALVWKLDGLSEYDVRRPLTPTGTNLLGIVKHVASVEAGYLGDTFGRPFPEPLPWFDEGAEANADMWATPEESRA